MFGRKVTRKVTRNLTHPIGLGWSLGTSPDGGPGPVAIITPDSQILPTFYTDGNGYFPTVNTQNGYTNISTYEGYTMHGVFFSGWDSTDHRYIRTWKWDFGDGSPYFYGINAGHIFETAGTFTVTLTVTDYLGRSSSATQTVIIHARGTGNPSMNVGTTNAPGTGTYALTTYYVDPTGGTVSSDLYDGKSQVWDGISTTSSGPWQTFNKVALALKKTGGTPISSWTIKPGDEILLKRGGTFNVNAVPTRYGHGGLSQGFHLGAYGTGANPSVQWVTPAAAAAWQANHSYSVGDLFYVNDANGQYGLIYQVTTAYTSGATHGLTEGNNVIGVTLIDAVGVGSGFYSITDIDFKFVDGTTSMITGLTGGSDQRRNIVVLRCGLYDAFNAPVYVSTTASAANTIEPYGFFVHDCIANQNNVVTSSVINFTYGDGNAWSLIGNTADKSGNHVAYLQSIKWGVIADNTFSRPAWGRNALRITGGNVATGREAKKIHITRNNFVGWIDPQTVDLLPLSVTHGTSPHAGGGGTSYNLQLLSLCDNGSLNEYAYDVVFDNNVISNYNVGVVLTNRVRHRLINNIWKTSSPGAAAIKVGKPAGGGTQAIPCDTIDISNNTFVCDGSSVSANNPMISIRGTDGAGSGYHPNLTIRNNIGLSVTGRTDVIVDFEQGDTYGQITNMGMDYNLVDSTNSVWARNYTTGDTYSLAVWGATFTGKDTHSQKTTVGVVTPPTPTAVHSPGTPSSLASVISEVAAIKAAYALTSTSVAINTGTTDANIWSDISAVARPVGGGVDLGAFEYPIVVAPPIHGVLLEGSTGFLLLENGSVLLVESGAAATTESMPVASALTGSEVIPIVQGGVTYNVTLNALKTYIQAP